MAGRNWSPNINLNGLWRNNKMGVPGDGLLQHHVVASCRIPRRSRLSFVFPLLCRYRLWKQYFCGDIFLESFTLPGMTMYHFLSAMVDGPGYLPLGWKPKEVFNFTYFIFPSFSLKMLLLKYLHLQGTPEELVNLLQWCSECAGYKAPRAHHCRKCGRYKIEFVFNQIQMSTFS